MKMAVVADFEKSTGFRLAGVTEVYTSPDSVKHLLQRMDLVLVFIQKNILDNLDLLTKKKVEESIQPSFIQLESDEAELKNLVRRTLGWEK